MPGNQPSRSADLSYELHALTARLDALADTILRDALDGLSYRRFLVLLMVEQMAPTTQRALAERLNVSEPSICRMIKRLGETGYLFSDSVTGGGNRRCLSLSEAGASVVRQGAELLSRQFADLVRDAGVSYASYQSHTRKLLAALDERKSAAAPALPYEALR